MIYVIATSQVKPESRDAFIKGAKECIAATRQEKGCIYYESHTGINDPNLFVVVERWETREDLNAHGRAPHMKVWREDLAPLKVSPTVIEIISDGKVENVGACRRDPGNEPPGPAPLERGPCRPRCTRFRRPSPAADSADRHARPGVSSRPGDRGRAAGG